MIDKKALLVGGRVKTFFRGDIGPLKVGEVYVCTETEAQTAGLSADDFITLERFVELGGNPEML